MPPLSVLLPVCNAQNYLAEAVDSILVQTMHDLEFIIVDDGSTDDTPHILANLHDPRIRVLTNASSMGVAQSLNKGITVAQGEFIARMDADDISLPHRLQTQLDFLRQHPTVGVLGSAYTLIDAQGHDIPLVLRTPPSHACCVWFLLYLNPFAHPTVMMRRSVLDDVGGYPPTKTSGQDLDLWCTLFTTTTFHNLTQPLLRYRRHSRQVSNAAYQQNVIQREIMTRQVVYRHLLGSEPDPVTIASLSRQTYKSPHDAATAIELLLDLYQSMERRYPLTAAERRWIRTECLRESLRAWKAFPVAATPALLRTLTPADLPRLAAVLQERARR